MTLLLLAGCTAISGQAEPAAPSATTPERPRDIRLDGIDPCTLLTEDQRAELKLDGRPVLDRSPTSLYPGGDVPSCTISGFEPRNVWVGLSLVTTTGIERYSADNLRVDIQPATVRGFPAVTARPQRFTEWCSVIVDVAPGQLLDVHFADGGGTPPVPQDQLCTDAAAVADQVMETLLSDG
ncbi:MAG TPA: DUF3558 domain-containing protein [Pseudonocardia sp.]|uniref:DUF3558 domain-containing protein n=1 Tax=Pseudonocardia sp. TaxID=60912 RepID=UPI002B4AFDA5|nr:DUF3558 domain-containing protein [Pseudonocardia sp.]HLU58248.1 DUF3558 domain-containing protein [Pseudonocardia sp.]